ncbi:MAG: lysylphosphatidylglycerol synthase transmembrane domain-containing protein [Desulfobia sp.]
MKVGRRLKLWLKLAISLALVFYLCRLIDFQAMKGALTRVDISFWILSTILGVASIVIHAWKYSILVKNTEIEHSVSQMFRINLITRFYALFMPTALGTEAVRWCKVTGGRKDGTGFLAATLFERSIFVSLLLAAGLIPFLIYPSPDDNLEQLIFTTAPILISALVLCLIFISYFVFSSFQEMVRSVSAKILPAKKWGEWLKIRVHNFGLSQGSPYLYFRIILLTIAWLMIYILRVYFLTRAVDVPLEIIDISWMASLVLLLQMLPISFSGIGVREGAYAYIFAIFGLPPESGILVGLLFFMQMLVYAAMGWIVELSGKA